MIKNRIKKKAGHILVALMLLISTMMAFAMPVTSDDYDPQATINFWFAASSSSLTIGDDFNLTCYLDLNTENCSAWEIELLTYNESRLWMTNSSDTTVWHIAFSGAFATGGTINNATGNVTALGAMDVTELYGNLTLFTINYTAQRCGPLYFNITNPRAQNSMAVWLNKAWNNETVYIYPQSSNINLSASTYNYTIINLTWDKPLDADRIVIERNTSATWSRGQGTELCNATNSSWNDTTCGVCTTYYYRAWGYNATHNLYTPTSDTAYNTTDCFTNFSFHGVTPTNSSTTANCTYSIPINVTVRNSYGQTFSYWINASNGQTTSGTGQAANTSIGRTLTGLSHNANYMWNVTVLQVGTADSIRAVYDFVTGVGGGTAPTAPSTPTPTNGATSVGIAVTTMSVLVTDTDGDAMNVTFYNATSGALLGYNASTASGTLATINPGLTLGYGQTFSWYARANDTCLNTTSATFSFTTDAVNISITKEWKVCANNTIQAWVNISNVGETNLTNVVINETYDTNVIKVGSNLTNDSGDLGSWTIPFLNMSGYADDNAWLVIFMNLSGRVANGTSISNTAKVTSHGEVNSSSPTALTMCFFGTKEANESVLEWNSTWTNYTINVTNCGDFYLNWVQVNETYDANTTYNASSITPDGTNTVFTISQIAPGATSTFYISLNTSYNAGLGDPLVNATRVWNNITIDSNETAPALTAAKDLFVGARTTMVRVSYNTQFTDIISITNTIFTIIGVVLMVALILGVTYVFYIRKTGGGYE